MLIAMPIEMAKNPLCYTEKEGHYIPTSIATPEERKAIQEFNRKWDSHNKHIQEERKQLDADIEWIKNHYPVSVNNFD